MLRAFLRATPVRFVLETVRRFNEDQSGVLAGYIAYASMMSGFPFMIFTISLVGLLVGRGVSDEATAALFAAVPEEVAATLRPVLREVVERNHGSILTLSAIGAIYGASNGVEAIRIGLDRAYDIEKRRNFVMNRLISVGFVFIGFVIFSALALLIIVAPSAFKIIEALTTLDIPGEIHVARYGAGVILLYGILWMMHRFLPDHGTGGLTLWPGIVVCIVIWGLAATGLSIYLSHSHTYALTYGALAGVVITLLFFYLTGVAIIFGAQVNAVVNFGLPPLENPAKETG